MDLKGPKNKAQVFSLGTAAGSRSHVGGGILPPAFGIKRFIRPLDAENIF